MRVMKGIATMRTTLRYLIVTVLAGSVLTSQAKGYGPLAHWIITPQDWDVRAAANLPDLHIWGSPAMVPLVQFTASYTMNLNWPVRPEFAWSHGCQTKGMLPAVPVSLFGHTYVWGQAPMTPTEYGVPQGVALPGEVMYYLCRNKLQDRPLMPYMLSTARGFACHNAEDSVVHFTYFRGGSDLSIQNPAWAWFVE